MRARSFLVPFAVALAFSACQQASDSAGGAQTAALDALREVRERHVEAILEGSVDDELATYTDSAVVIPPDHQGVVGTQEIRAWLQGSFDSFTVEQLELNVSDYTIRGDLAVAHYRYSWSLAPAGGGEPVPGTGQGLWVLERQADGRWLIAYDIWNRNRSVATAD